MTLRERDFKDSLIKYLIKNMPLMIIRLRMITVRLPKRWKIPKKKQTLRISQNLSISGVLVMQ